MNDKSKATPADKWPKVWETVVNKATNHFKEHKMMTAGQWQKLVLEEVNEMINDSKKESP